MSFCFVNKDLGLAHLITQTILKQELNNPLENNFTITKLTFFRKDNYCVICSHLNRKYILKPLKLKILKIVLF